MESNRRRIGAGSAIAVIGAIVILLVIANLTGKMFYVLEQVDQQEVGVQFRQGRISNIVGPGIYSDFGLSVEIKRVSSQAIPFGVRDEEIITRDKQRVGVAVSGDIFRPNLARKDLIETLWAQYSGVYLNDDLAKTRVQDLARQAMKVCVGERTFDDNIIGTARDALRSCIDDELSKLAGNYGLQIENVVVPEIVLSPEVQKALDAIVASRLETEKAAQDKLRAAAQADAERAKQEGEIRVAQSRIQEETRQQTTLAKLEQEKTLAQRAVIEAQKANDLLGAQRDLEINKARASAASEKAKADLAGQLALADLYAKNPAYLQLQIVTANAGALKATDKIIFTPVGTTPTIVIPGPGITPTVNTNNPQP